MKRYACLFLLLPLIFSCGSDPVSVIDKTVREIAAAAEDRDIDSFMSFISPEYSDPDQHDRAAVREMIGEYFERYRGISVNILNIRIVKNSEDQAEVITEVNFSIGIARLLTKVVKSIGETYRFGLRLKHRRDGWSVSYAEWEWVSFEELYPESMKVLKELFPGSF